MRTSDGDGLSLRLPPGWHTHDVPVDAPPVDLLAVGPAGHDGYVPSVVVTHQDGAPGPLQQWAEREVMGPEGALTTVRILDTASVPTTGQPAVMHLSTLTLQGRSLTQVHLAVDEGGAGPLGAQDAVGAGGQADGSEPVGTPAQAPLSADSPGTRRSAVALTCSTADFPALEPTFEQMILSVTGAGRSE